MNPNKISTPIIALTTPISESKCYSFYDYARGLYELDFPKEQLYVVFVVDSNGANKVSKKVNEFVEHWPYPERVSIVSTYIANNNPKSSNVLKWEERAKIAAHLRQMYTEYIRDMLSDITHVFSVGSDIVLEPDSLNKLLEAKKDLVTGLYISRRLHNKLALWYEQPDKWGYIDIPVDLTIPMKIDWSGLDCALYRKKLLQIDWEDFSADKYGIGEDGYFYLEAKKKLKTQAWLHSDVRPLHIHDNGIPVAARDIPQFGLNITCPNCGWQSRIGKLYRDVNVGCGGCKKIFTVDPYWEPRNINDQPFSGLAVSNLTKEKQGESHARRK